MLERNSSGLHVVQVPWSSLGQDPVVVQMDRLFLLARPQPETARQAIATPEDVDKAYQASKRQWVSSHETKWLEQLDALDKAKEEAASDEKEPANGGGLFGGFARIKGAIETAIGACVRVDAWMCVHVDVRARARARAWRWEGGGVGGVW